MATPTGFVTSQDGSTIAFDRVGDGPAIILVGGATQHRWIDPDTAKLADLLASDFTVYHYDRRGRGDSSDCSDPLAYTISREIEDIAALIDHAGGSAHLFSMSSGGALVLNAAAAGLPIRRMALYEPPFNADPNDSLATVQTYMRHLKELHTAGRHGEMVTYFLTNAIGLPSEAVAQMRGEPIWERLEAIAPTLIYDTTLMFETQRDKPLTPEQWANVTQPTLVLDGGDSFASFRDAVQLIANTLPNATRYTLLGHAHAYDPEALAPVLKAFYAG